MKDWWLTRPFRAETWVTWPSRAEDATPHRHISYLRQRLRTLDSDTAVLLLLVGLALVSRILYVLANPPFLTPDENGHYEYVASLYQGWDNAVRGGEAHQPLLYYLLVLPAFALGVMREPPNLEIYALAVGKASLTALFAARLVSALISTAAVPLAYCAAKTICPKDRFVYLGTAAFVALAPMYSSIGASMNNDALANTLSSALVYVAVWGIAQGFSFRRTLLLAILAGAALDTKASTLLVVGMASVVVAAQAIAWAQLRWALPTRVVLAAVGSAVLAAVLLTVHAATTSGMVARLTSGPYAPLGAGKAAAFMAQLDAFPFVYQFKTFWATFYNDAIQLPSPAYWFLALLCGGSGVGLLLRLLDAARHGGSTAPASARRRAWQLMFMVGLVALQWVLSLLRFYNSTTVNAVIPVRVAGWSEPISVMQGRFLFPAIVALAFLFTYGLKRLVPVRLERQALATLVATLLVVDVLALLTLLISFYSWQH